MKSGDIFYISTLHRTYAISKKALYYSILYNCIMLYAFIPIAFSITPAYLVWKYPQIASATVSMPAWQVLFDIDGTILYTAFLVAIACACYYKMREAFRDSKVKS